MINVISIRTNGYKNDTNNKSLKAVIFIPPKRNGLYGSMVDKNYKPVGKRGYHRILYRVRYGNFHSRGQISAILLVEEPFESSLFCLASCIARTLW